MQKGGVSTDFHRLLEADTDNAVMTTLLLSAPPSPTSSGGGFALSAAVAFDPFPVSFAEAGLYRACFRFASLDRKSVV